MNIKRWNGNKKKYYLKESKQIEERKTETNYKVANTKDVLLAIKKCNKKYAKALKRLAD
ncbi:hypothetical protein [Clostridium botulinum]|uniref:hypothetical protein n=1 Tax=Clostridium botulinum TaxID=1491 RepID=UPI0018727683|nr:hypothetical protein [Clostridium botulinum]